MGAEAVAAAVAERFPRAGTATQAGSGTQPAGAEFVIFSKPELGRLSSADLAAVWDLFASSFASYDVTVHRVKIMTGPELDQAGVMQRHYGVINQISRLGRPALTEAAEQSLSEMLADAPEDTEVLGGHQFLERYAEISPFALAMLFSNAKASRLGPGTYAVADNSESIRGSGTTTRWDVDYTWHATVAAPTAVPEPASLLLAATGLAVGRRYARRRAS